MCPTPRNRATLGRTGPYQSGGMRGVWSRRNVGSPRRAWWELLRRDAGGLSGEWCGPVPGASVGPLFWLNNDCWIPLLGTPGGHPGRSSGPALTSDDYPGPHETDADHLVNGFGPRPDGQGAGTRRVHPGDEGVHIPETNAKQKGHDPPGGAGRTPVHGNFRRGRAAVFTLRGSRAFPYGRSRLPFRAAGVAPRAFSRPRGVRAGGRHAMTGPLTAPENPRAPLPTALVQMSPCRQGE